MASNDILPYEKSVIFVSRKTYEFSDHLGNVSATISDRKITIAVSAGNAVASYTPEVLSEQDYFPFGMGMMGRSVTAEGYRYGFNGKEKESDTFEGAYDFGARILDTRLGRWLSVDPKGSELSSWSTYCSMANNPVLKIDPDGMKFINFDEEGNYIGITGDNFFHNLFWGTKGRVKYSGKRDKVFSFSDPEKDVPLIVEEKVIKKLIIVEDIDIERLVSKAGGFRSENKTWNRGLTYDERYGYIKEEAKANGELDFSYTKIPGYYPGASEKPLKEESPFIWLVGSKAHNHMNFGNFLYGAAGQAMGFTRVELLGGAHMNSKYPKAPMTGERVPEGQNSANGYPPQWDSLDDQYSILDGWNHANSRKFEQKETKIEVGAAFCGPIPIE